MSKLTIKKPGWRYWPRSGVFIVINFWKNSTHCSGGSIVGFEEAEGGCCISIMPDEGVCSWYLRQGWNDYVTVCLIIKLKFLGISDTIWLQTFLFAYYYCLWGYPFMTSTKNGQQMTSHFDHPQKWTIDLLTKIMGSANNWPILRTSLTTFLLCKHK